MIAEAFPVIAWLAIGVAVALWLLVVISTAWAFWRLMSFALLVASGLLAGPALAHAPTFTMTPIGALCGPLAEHLRILDAANFEPTWRGAGEGGGGAFLVINDEGYWILLLVFPEAPDVACVVASGPRFSYAPSPL